MDKVQGHNNPKELYNFLSSPGTVTVSVTRRTSRQVSIVSSKRVSRATYVITLAGHVFSNDAVR
jgi:hypothetical protein